MNKPIKNRIVNLKSKITELKNKGYSSQYIIKSLKLNPKNESVKKWV